jgi:hypothetical protein
MRNLEALEGCHYLCADRDHRPKDQLEIFRTKWSSCSSLHKVRSSGC